MTAPRLKTVLRLLAGTTTAAALAIGGLAATTVPASAATTDHFVDCAAKANGDGGSAASAWNSLDAIRAHGAFTSGDRILLKRGTTCKGQLTFSGSGAKGAPIVVGAYGSGAQPTVAGGGTPNNSGAVQLVNQQYVTLQDLHVTNRTKSASTKTYRSGVLVYNNGTNGPLSGVVVQRLHVDTVYSNPGNGNTRAYGGISALTWGTSGGGFRDLRILNNRVSHVSRTGIVTSNVQYPKGWDAGTRISGNTVSNVRGDGIVLIGAKSSRIDSNKVSGAANLGECAHCGRLGGPSTASAGIWPSNAKSIRIDHNEVWGTHRGGGDGEAFDIDRGARDVVLEYNYAHDNQGGGVLVCGATDSTIRFNVFEDNQQAALSFYGKAPAKNTAFYNNTVYAAKSAKAKVVRTFGGIKGGAVSFNNNVVFSYGPGQYQWPSKKITTAANTLIGTHGAGRPADRRTSWGNPGLKAAGTGKTGVASLKGYKPRSSKTFPKGVAIPKSVKTDFFGKKISATRPPRGAAG